MPKLSYCIAHRTELDPLEPAEKSPTLLRPGTQPLPLLLPHFLLGGGGPEATPAAIRLHPEHSLLDWDRRPRAHILLPFRQDVKERSAQT